MPLRALNASHLVPASSNVLVCSVQPKDPLILPSEIEPSIIWEEDSNNDDGSLRLLLEAAGIDVEERKLFGKRNEGFGTHSRALAMRLHERRREFQESQDRSATAVYRVRVELREVINEPRACAGGRDARRD